MRKKIIVELYGGYRLNVIVGEDINESIKAYSKHMRRAYRETIGVEGMFVDCGRHTLTGWIYIRPDSKAHVIAHECLHATYNLARQVGLDYSDEGEEAFTYLLEFFVKRVMEIQELYNAKNITQ